MKKLSVRVALFFSLIGMLFTSCLGFWEEMLHSIACPINSIILYDYDRGITSDVDEYNPIEFNVGDTYEVTSSSVSFAPVFTPITYDIIYHLDGGSNGGGNPSTYDIETSTINLADATKAGYVFVGWYGDNLFTEGPITSIPKGSIGNVDLYAKYIREVSIVNPEWAGTGNGTKVSYSDTEYTFGTDAFATIASAVAAASPYEQIYVLAGTYSDAFTISTNDISLLGPNNGVDAVNGSRETEAVITNVITITTGVSNTTISGFKFTGAGQIYTTSDDSGSIINGIEGLTFNYNYVDKTGNTTPAIYLNDGNRVYSKDISINYCYFTAPNLAEVESGKSGLIFTRNNENITVTNSKFYNISLNAIGAYDTANGNGSGGDIIIENNIFSKVTGSAFWTNYYHRIHGTTPNVSISSNIFYKVSGGACIDFEKTQSTAPYTSFRIELNVFKDVVKCFYGYTNAGMIFTNNIVFKYASQVYVARGASATNKINCATNLYLDESTPVLSPKGNGFTFHAGTVSTENENASNYSSIGEYNTATSKNFKLSDLDGLD